MTLEIRRGEKAEDLRCAFCDEGENQVGDLVVLVDRGVPQAAICSDCADRCRELLDAQGERDLTASPEVPDTGVGIPVGPVRCLLCFLPKDVEEITVIPNRGALCSVCVEAVRVATD
jgi:hypothetical protein